MTERDMFEASFQRPSDYFQLTADHQWAIDARLGILDWQGGNLTPDEKARFKAHYQSQRRGPIA